MIRLGLLAFAATSLILGVSAANAQGASYYAAVPVTTPSKTQLITRDTVWTWHATAFTARRGDARDTIQCELVARQVGKLSSFSAAGTAFDAAALEKCNAKAK